MAVAEADRRADSGGLTESVRRPAVWTAFGHGAGEAIRFGTNVVMARLLAPEAFGLMALVNTFLQGLKMFSDLGLNVNIIQNKRGTDDVFLNTAWTLQVIRGAVLFLILGVIAWPVARVYEQPQLLWLLVATGTTVLLSGFYSTGIATSYRRLQPKRLILAQLASQAVSVVVTIVWAFLYPNVWAFVGGVIVSSAMLLILSHRLDPSHRDGFAWDATARRDLITFGRWIFVSTAMTFLAAQADRLILGKLLDISYFGLYGIATGMAKVPERLISMLSHHVLLPFLSKYKNEREVLQKAMHGKRDQLLLLGGGMALVPMLVGDVIIRFLYPAEYQEAGPMLALLACGTWLFTLTVSAKQALLAVGEARYNAAASASRFVGVAVGLPAAFAYGGMPAAIVLVAFAELPVYVINMVGLHRERLSCLVRDVRATLILAAVAGGLLMLRHTLGFGFPWDSP